MELILKRIAKRLNYTIGKLYIKTEEVEEFRTYTNDVYFCDTLEPTVLELKTTVSKDAVLRSPAKASAYMPATPPKIRRAASSWVVTKLSVRCSNPANGSTN